MELRDKVCLITGGSGGIGEALGRELVAAGAKLVLFARREAELNRIVADLGAENAVAVTGDVTNADDLKAAVQAAVATFGRLDVLVNNAGVMVLAPLTTIPREVIDQGFGTNVIGPILAIQAAVPEIQKTGGGMVVNVSSGMSLRPSPNASIYSAAKAALNLLSASLRVELKDKGIHVMTAHPGLIGNDFGSHLLFADEELVKQVRGRAGTNSTSTRTSEDAGKQIIAAMREDREVTRSNEAAPIEMPL